MAPHRYKISVNQVRGRKRILAAESELSFAWFIKALEAKLEELQEI